MAEVTIEQLQAENEALSAELAETKAQLAAARGVATRAKRAAAVLRLDRSPVARKIGRPRAAFGKPGAPYDRALAAMAIEDGEVEIVASDGKNEIVDLQPFSATPDAWFRAAGGFVLRDGLLLEPGDIAHSHIDVAGFGLLSGGEQVGWCELPEPVAVPKNSRVRIERSVAF